MEQVLPNSALVKIWREGILNPLPFNGNLYCKVDETEGKLPISDFTEVEFQGKSVRIYKLNAAFVKDFAGIVIFQQMKELSEYTINRTQTILNGLRKLQKIHPNLYVVIFTGKSYGEA